MIAYYNFHPLNKYANFKSIQTPLINFYKNSIKSLNDKIKNLKDPNYYKDFIKNNAIEIAGGATGLIGGAYLGNKLYNNSLPPVRALPEIQQSPLLEVEN